MQPGFDRSRRHAQDVGNLPIIAVLNVPQHHDGPVLVVQLRQGLLDGGLGFGGEQLARRVPILGVLPAAGRFPVAGIGGRPRHPNPLPFSAMAEARVHRNAKEPRVQAARALETRQVLVRLDEHFLHQVPGVLGRPHHPVDGVVEPVLVAFDDRAERGSIASDDLADQFRVCRSAAGSESDRKSVV